LVDCQKHIRGITPIAFVANIMTWRPRNWRG